MAGEPGNPPDFVRYSGEHLPERDRFAVWREVVGPSFLRLDVSRIPEHPFHTSGLLLALPGLGVQWADNTGIRMDRTRNLIADGSDDLILPLVTSGRHYAVQRGNETALDTQNTALLSSGDIGSVWSASRSRAIVLRLPRSGLAHRTPRLDDLLGRSIPRRREALRLLTIYVRLLRTDVAQMSLDLQRLAVAHVYDLIALAIGSTSEGTEIASGRGLRAARLRAAKADIAENLSSPDLSPVAVAGRLGISPRYLHKLFEGEGTSFSQFVLGRRLAAAHAMLSDPRHDALSITDIAYLAGFGDLSHFNRSFRQRYGATPRETRRTPQG
jgi:AraC-like DNA-binding protein